MSDGKMAEDLTEEEKSYLDEEKELLENNSEIEPHPQTGDTTQEQARELLFKGAKQCSHF